MKTTTWFPASTPPVRVGWYECMYHVTGESFCEAGMKWWNGKDWKYHRNGQISSFGLPTDLWCGLTEEAK